MNCWGKASLALPKLGEAWLPDPALSGKACEWTQGGGSEGWSQLCLAATGNKMENTGNKMGLRHAPAAKGSLCEGAKGSVKRVNEPVLASLLLCKCFLFPFRWESKKPSPSMQTEPRLQGRALPHSCVCTPMHKQGFLAYLTSF